MARETIMAKSRDEWGNGFAQPQFGAYSTPGEKLEAVLAWAREHCSYYNARIPDHRPDAFAALRKVAPTSGDDWKRLTATDPYALCTGLPAACYVFGSGGTTGTPKNIFRTHAENRLNAMANARGLSAGGLRAGHGVLNMLYGGEMWAGMTAFSQALEELGCVIFNLGNTAPAEQVGMVAERFQPQAVIAMPTQMVGLANAFKVGGLSRVRLPYVFTAGESFYDAQKALVREVFGVERFHALTYAANDTGALGYQCLSSDPMSFHVHDDLNVLEIVDPHTNEAVKAGEAGSLLVTSLYRTLMPVVRYQVGDRCSYVTETCECGSSRPRIRLLGRLSDQLRFSAVVITPAEISQLIQGVDGVATHLQLLATRTPSGLDQLTVHTEVTDASVDASVPLRTLEARVKGHRLLQKEVEAGRIAPTLVRLDRPGGVPRNPRTGKIAAVVDQRS